MVTIIHTNVQTGKNMKFPFKYKKRAITEVTVAQPHLKSKNHKTLQKKTSLEVI